MPEPTVPEDAVPEDAVPEDAVPEDAVPAERDDQTAGIITKTARGSVTETVAALVREVLEHGMTVFATVDHSAEARRHGLELRDTTVVMFGSPEAGTPVMQASPLAALDLPLKVLVWDDGGSTRISFTDPSVLAARHHLSDDLAARLRGIGPLTDRLVG
jgi:uncharacterized protein (DUF302 family)